MPSFSLSLQEQIQIAIALQERRDRLQELVKNIAPEDTQDAQFFGEQLRDTRSALDTLDKMIR